MKLSRLRPTPAMVVAGIALVVALGGTSYAAFKLPKGSVDSQAIRKGAVTSSKVRDGALRARDFGRGTLLRGTQGPRGATGPQGPQGLQGPVGPPGPGARLAYAAIEPDGSVHDASGITAANVRVEGGQFCLHDLPYSVKHAQATVDTGSTLDGYTQVDVHPEPGSFDFCSGNSDQVEVRRMAVDQSNPNQPESLGA